MRIAPNKIEENEWLNLVDEYNTETDFNKNWKDIQSKRDLTTRVVIPGISKSRIRQSLFRLYNDKCLPYEAICHCDKKMNKIYPIVMKLYNTIKINRDNE